MKQKFYKSTILILTLVCILSVITSLSYAYFSSDLIINGYANLKIELLFDKFDDQALTEYQSQFKNLKEGDLEWGHKGNPYVISQERHVSNLSILQNIGYFYNNFISNNYNGSTLVGNSNYNDGYDVPYFVIANPNGSPTVIDTSKRTIKPVGTEEYPFIGSITGVTSSTSTTSYVIDGKVKTSKTSGIHGVKVQTPKSTLDYGFFGHVSYLGDEDLENGAFYGYVSTISNILFSDVQIIAKTTLWEEIKDALLSHFFYKNTGSGIADAKDPEETHHIGIAVGHAEYVKMSAISIYYSSDSVEAINLTDRGRTNEDKPFNYVSSTGYIGFMYNLNPSFNEQGQIIVGSGIDSSEISYGYQGGGGLNSGILPGYIRADQMYKIYSFSAKDATQIEKLEEDPLYVLMATDENGVPLATLGTNNNYYFTDGVFTFALSDGQKPDGLKDPNNIDSAKYDTIESIWEPNKIDKITLSSSGWEIGKDPDRIVYFRELTPIESLDALNEELNKEKEKPIFLLGDLTGTTFTYMDISAAGTVKGIEKTLTTSQDNALKGIWFETEDDANGVTNSAVKITKNNNNTYVIEDYNEKNDNDVKEDDVITNKLGVQRNWSILTYRYKIYSGTGGNNISTDLTIEQDEDNNNQFYISAYNVYIQYSDEGSSGTFYTSDYNIGWTDNAYPFRIYKLGKSVEPKNYSPDVYIPKDAETSIKLDANKYVFYPEQVYGTGTSNGTNPKQVDNANISYKVMPIIDLKYKTDNGDNVVNTIDKMFNIKQSVDWGVAFKLLNYNFDFGSQGGIVAAPVGTGAYERTVYIPTGAVAFYINKVPKDGTAKIKVIVKIPSTNTVGGLNFDGGTDDKGQKLGDHFLGIWKGKERSSSWFDIAGFDIDNAYQKVKLPRSHPLIEYYEDKTLRDYNNVSPNTQYLNVNYYENDVFKGNYTTMLQGGYYLLAYTFEVNTEGVYILAATTGINMQLAYCSVDGVASAGRDGSAGSLLGDIDFVYDNGEQVLLVTDGGVDEDTGKEDPTKYYYESFVLVHFKNVDDNGNRHTINDEILVVRRWAGGDLEIKTNIKLNIVTGTADCPINNECDHIHCSPIKSISDNVEKSTTPK